MDGQTEKPEVVTYEIGDSAGYDIAKDQAPPENAIASLTSEDVEVGKSASEEELDPEDGSLPAEVIVEEKDQPEAENLDSSGGVCNLARSQRHVEDVTEVKNLVLALLELTQDKQEDITSSTICTLHKLGTRHPATVLRTLVSTLTGDNKSFQRFRSTVLTIIETSIAPAVELEQLDADLADSLVRLAIDMMVSVSEQPDIQIPASNILVAVGAVYCKQVMQELQGRLQPIPHQYILSSLASLATQNIYGFVPHLKNVLDILVTMLPQVKGTTTRLSFATALAKFSEALNFYLDNIDRAPDPYVKRQWFTEEMGQAFDVLYGQWLPSKVAVLNQEILEALGYMSQLLPEDRLEHTISKVLPSLLNAYRGPVEPLYVTRCLALFLEAFLRVEKEIKDSHLLDLLLNTLFSQGSLSPDYAQPSTVKNHYEILRCFEVVARSHLSQVLTFLLLKTDLPAEKNRITALSVIKHLVNSLKDQLVPHMPTIQTSLKPLLNDARCSNGVRKALAQTIVAMAVQGFLNDQGSAGDFISFLLKLCTLPQTTEETPSAASGLESFLASATPRGSSQGATGVSNSELRQMCENIVQLLVTTQPLIVPILWPHLLSYGVDKEYNRAIPVLARALPHLVTRLREEQVLTLPPGDAPSSAAVTARFLVLVCRPLPWEKGVSMLQFLQHFASFIDPTLERLWDAELPPLINQLKTKMPTQDSWDGERAKWFDSIQTLAQSTLSVMKHVSSQWNQDFALALVNQIPLYESDQLERGFLLALIGVTAHQGVPGQSPGATVDLIMNSVRHQFVEESQGCARAMGICARSHLDVVLLRLQNMERNDYGRKISGIMGFMKGRSESEADLYKATAARCYGRIALEVPVTEILLKMDKIMKSVLHILHTSKDPSVRLEGLEAIRQIGEALSPTKTTEVYILPGRPEMLKETLSQLKTIPLNDSKHMSVSDADLVIDSSRFCIKAVQAMSALVILPPGVGSDDQSILLDAAYEYGITHYSKLMTASLDFPPALIISLHSAGHDLLNALERLSLSLLREALHPATMDVIFSKLFIWTKSRNDAMRLASMTILKLSLELFRDGMTFEPGAPSRFCEGHSMLAKILPRVTDPHPVVRDLAIDSVGLIVQIISKYLGYSDDYESATLATLEGLKPHLGSTEPAESLNTLATILNSKTASSDLWSFLESMVTELIDPFSSSSCGVSVLLTTILKIRGGEIHLRIKDLLDHLLSRLKLIECRETRRSVLNAVAILGTHQRDTVAAALLAHSLPRNEDIADCWKTLAANASLGPCMLEYLIDIITYAVPYEERGQANESIASYRLLSAVSAMNCMCQVHELSNSLQAHFPQLLCVTLLAQSCLLGAAPPIHSPSTGDKVTFVPNREAYRMNPYKIATDTLKQMLTCANLIPMIDPINHFQHLENSGDATAFSQMVAKIAALTTVYLPAQLPKILFYLGQALKSAHERHRIVGVSFLAELIYQRCGGRDGEMLETIIHGLTASLADSTPLVRQAALKGLGGLGLYEARHVKNFCPSVLDALMNGLEEDGHEKIETSGTAREALEGLKLLIPVAPSAEIERLACRLTLRARPFFEHQDPHVRQVAVALLADVLMAGSTTPARDYLAEQVHATLTSLLIHLNETDPEVVKACKSALRQAGPFLDCPEVNAMFQTHLPDGGRLNYVPFITDVVKLIAVHLNEWMSTIYLQTALSYFKSVSPELRTNAALFVGLVGGHSLNSPNSRNIAQSLTRLLHDPNKMVKLQAIEAVSLMFG